MSRNFHLMMIQTLSTAAAAMLLSLTLLASAQSLRYSRVSREVVESRLARYAGDNKQRETTLKQVFTEAGCGDRHLSEQAVKNLNQPNVICLLPGSSDRVIIVGAHFDHVPTSDGVADNWSGASLLPSLYQSIKSEPRTHTYVFIGFAGEEVGEIGSRFYAQHMSVQDVAATDAMVNMDTLGLGPTQVWGSHSDKLLMGSLGYIANRLNVPVSIVNVEQVGSSDSEQFAARKIPRITIHSLTQKSWQARIIHTSKDRISAIQADDYYQTYGLVAAYVTFLDEIPNRSTMPPTR
jgi:Zn-dependent M28 family amino/carboxypeptidase